MSQTEEANGRRGVGGALQTAWKPVFDFWTEAVAAGGEQAEALLAGLTGASDPVVARRRWLRGLARGCDAFLRTPAFLTLLQRQLDVLSMAKGYTDRLTDAWARLAGVPRLPDISGLFERLKIGQDTILDRLTTIEGQLQARPAQAGAADPLGQAGLTPKDVEEFKQAWHEWEESKGDWSKSH
jgi:hypothetical protein